jgi:hypothetical protein
MASPTGTEAMRPVLRTKVAFFDVLVFAHA